MEAKRTNTQTIHKTGSRLSTTKNQGNAAKEGVTPSKTEVLKTGSQASLTPSQAAELAKQNDRKNPLDVLSRTAIRPITFARRSGLQDVDDEFLKNNVFSRKLNPRHMGLDNYTRIPPVATPAGVQSVPTTETAVRNRGGGGGGGNTAVNGVVEAAGVPTPVSPSRSQLKSPPEQEGQAPAQGGGVGGAGGQTAKQQNQANHQRPAAGISSHGNNAPSAPNPTPSQMQCKAQSNANANINNNNTNQQSNGIQGQQQNSPRPSAGGDNGTREPDMCTTCPNCQTTIYLVRPNDNEMASTTATGGQNNYYQQEPMQGLGGHTEAQAVSASGN